MLNFFYSLFFALFTGEWYERDIIQDNEFTFQELVTWVGSIFSDDTFNFNLDFTACIQLLAAILSIVVVVGLSFFVINLIKRVFTIFFNGVR